MARRDNSGEVGFMPSTVHTRRWGYAWLGMATALALHVVDEATTGFLPLYNSVVSQLRE